MRRDDGDVEDAGTARVSRVIHDGEVIGGGHVSVGSRLGTQTITQHSMHVRAWIIMHGQ